MWVAALMKVSIKFSNWSFLLFATWSAFSLSYLASLQWTLTSERVRPAPHRAADFFHASTLWGTRPRRSITTSRSTRNVSSSHNSLSIPPTAARSRVSYPWTFKRWQLRRYISTAKSWGIGFLMGSRYGSTSKVSFSKSRQHYVEEEKRSISHISFGEIHKNPLGKENIPMRAASIFATKSFTNFYMAFLLFATESSFFAHTSLSFFSLEFSSTNLLKSASFYSSALDFSLSFARTWSLPSRTFFIPSYSSCTWFLSNFTMVYCDLISQAFWKTSTIHFNFFTSEWRNKFQSTKLFFYFRVEKYNSFDQLAARRTHLSY